MSLGGIRTYIYCYSAFISYTENICMHTVMLHIFLPKTCAIKFTLPSRQGMKRAWTVLSDVPMWCQFIKREEQINPEKFIQFGHEKKLYAIKMLPPRLIWSFILNENARLHFGIFFFWR